MRKNFILLLLLFLVFPVVAGAQDNTQDDLSQVDTVSTSIEINDSNAGARSIKQIDRKDSIAERMVDQNMIQVKTEEGERTQVKFQNKGAAETVQVQNKIQVRAKNVEELKKMIQERKVEAGVGFNELKSAIQKKVYQNQNKVRLAVQTLLAAEDLTGGIGKQVSEIARDFDNSIEATVKAEERIQAKSRFKKFLFGGEKEAAASIKEKIKTNLPKIEKLKELYEQCNCTDDIKTILEEQISNLEQEQIRLNQLSNTEISSNGIFGWALRWFK